MVRMGARWEEKGSFVATRRWVLSWRAVGAGWLSHAYAGTTGFFHRKKTLGDVRQGCTSPSFQIRGAELLASELLESLFPVVLTTNPRH
jgi:hypothetical protein